MSYLQLLIIISTDASLQPTRTVVTSIRTSSRSWLEIFLIIISADASLKAARALIYTI